MTTPSRASSITTDENSIKSQLLAEYIQTLPLYEQLVDIARTEIEYNLLPIKAKQKPWERIEISSRVKSFESAFDKLKRSKEANILEPGITFNELNDMAAIKIKVFPNDYLKPIQKLVEKLYSGAIPDHSPDRQPGVREKEYYGQVTRLKYIIKLHRKYNIDKKLEIQIVPYLLDAFLEIEHDIIYKPNAGIPKVVPSLLEEHNPAIIDNLKSWPSRFSEYMKVYGKL